MEKTQLLCRMILTGLFIMGSGTASAQTADAWLDQRLSLQRQGWEERARAVFPDQNRPSPPVIAFVSFAMPNDSLKAILEQVDRVGGTVVLRGLVNNSFKDTATAVARLVSDGSPGIKVDPKLFSTYAIKTVPAFVVPTGTEFDKISGNISLAAALEAIIREGDDPDTARRLLIELRGARP